MSRRFLSTVAAVAAVATIAVPALAPGPAAGSAARGTPPLGPGTAGPPYDYATELMGSYALLPLPDQAALTKTEHGYLFRAGQQDSRLEVTLTDDGIRFVDTGTARFKKLVRACDEEDVPVGVAAVCPVPDDVSTAAPLLVEFWPRLGDDYLDASTLPDTVAMTMLSDAGDDIARLRRRPGLLQRLHRGRPGLGWRRQRLDPRRPG